VVLAVGVNACENVIDCPDPQEPDRETLDQLSEATLEKDNNEENGYKVRQGREKLYMWSDVILLQQDFFANNCISRYY